jgi:hypothetical protein
MTPLMIDDKREIKLIFKEYGSYTVGIDGIEKIVIYQEPGSMGYINYAAIYKNGEIIVRVDLSGWGIGYL